MGARYGVDSGPGARLGDERLVAAARTGDAGALDQLLRGEFDRIHALCSRITGNAEDALDATQEALIAIARGVARFDGRSAFSTWAYRVATNAALDEVRRRRRRPVPVAVEDPGAGAGSLSSRHEAALGSATPDPASGVADRIDIDRALGGLAPEHRAAVVLRDLLGLEYSEIAEVLGIPIGTVRSRIARGRVALAGELGGGRADGQVAGNSEGPSERRTTDLSEQRP